MDPETLLRTAIDRVYSTFGGHPRPLKLEMSPVCDPADLAALLHKPLRLLGVDDLSGYASSAMTTVGTVEDYKHFLPRILELAVGSALIEPEIIALKLVYGDWSAWPQQEITSAADLFLAAGIQAVDEHTDEYEAHSWLCGVAILGLDLRPIMRAWQSSTSTNSVLQLACLIRATTLFANDVDEQGYWSDVKPEVIGTIRAWLLSQEMRGRLMSSRLSCAAEDLWMVDQALDEQEQLLKRRPQ